MSSQKEGGECDQAVFVDTRSGGMRGKSKPRREAETTPNLIPATDVVSCGARRPYVKLPMRDSVGLW